VARRRGGALVVGRDSPSAAIAAGVLGAIALVHALLAARAIARRARATELAPEPGRAANLASLAICVLILVPWAVRLPSPDVDGGWQMVLDHAFAAKLAFGREIAFTYGPWGFLCGTYDPRLDALQLGAWVVLVVAWWSCAWPLSREASRPGVALAWHAAVVAVLSTSREGFLYTLAPTLVLHRFGAGARAREAALAAAIGASGLVKLPLLVLGAIAIAALTIDDARRRRAPRALAAWLAAVLAAGSSRVSGSATCRASPASRSSSYAATPPPWRSPGSRTSSSRSPPRPSRSRRCSSRSPAGAVAGPPSSSRRGPRSC
jgi:hypothetical protein